MTHALRNRALGLAGALALPLLGAGCANQPGTDAPEASVAASVAGPQLTADPTQGLGSDTRVTVTGTGYDTSKGIYVAFCVKPPQGQPPSPCGGGADTSGSTGASHWISSNPPEYGKDLAQPYGPDGSFSVILRIEPRIGDTDCRTAECGIVTRADHTRTSDRSADVFLPVTFKENS